MRNNKSQTKIIIFLWRTKKSIEKKQFSIFRRVSLPFYDCGRFNSEGEELHTVQKFEMTSDIKLNARHVDKYG